MLFRMKWPPSQRILDLQGDVQAIRRALRGVVDRIDDVESRPISDVDLEPIHRHFQEHEALLDDIGRRLKDMTLAIGEGIERTERAERRVRATVQRARKELAGHGFSDPAVEAEAAELHLVDGDGGGGGEVQGVPPGLESTEPSDEERLRNERLTANLRLRGLA